MSNNIERYVDSLISKFGKSGLIRALDLAEEKFRHFDETSKGMINKLVDLDLNEASLERLKRFGNERTGEILIANNAIKKLKGLLSETNLGAPKFEEVRNDTILLMKSFDELRGKAQNINKGFNLGIDYSSSFEGISRAYKRKEQEEKRLTEQKKQEEVAARQTERAAKEEAKQAAKEQAQAVKEQEKAAREAAKSQEQAAKQAAREQAQVAKEQEKAAKEAAREQEKIAKQTAKEHEHAAKAAAKEQEKIAKEMQRIEQQRRDTKSGWFIANGQSNNELNNFVKKYEQIVANSSSIKSKMTNNDDILGFDKSLERLKLIKEQVEKLQSDISKAGNDTNLKNSIQKQIAGYKYDFDKEMQNYQNLSGMPSSFESDTLSSMKSVEKIEAVKKVCEQISNVISKIKNVVNNVIGFAVKCFQKLAQAIKLCISIIVSFKNAISKVLSLLGGFGNRVAEIISLKGAMEGLAKVTDLVCNSFNKFLSNGFISQGLGLEQSLKSMEIIIGEELTSSTKQWAAELERGFGLSANGIITDLKELTGVMYGLGMSAEDTSIASKNLLMVGNTLSNIIGYDTATVIGKIQSGMKGMTASVDDLGLSVREPEMDAFLKKLKAQGGEYQNIATGFASLTEEQRVYVRYASLMQQYMDNYNIDDYIKSLEGIPGRINLLKNQIRSLASTIGQYMLSMFDSIIKPIIVFVSSLTSAVQFVANILKSQEEPKEENNTVDNIKESADEAAKSVADVTSNVEDLQASLDGLDHITNLSSSSSSGTSGSDFDYSSLMDMYDTQLFEDLENEAKAKINGYIQDTKTELSEAFKTWFKEITGREVKLKFNVDDLKKKIERIVISSNSIFSKVGNIIGATFIKCLEDLQIDKLSSTLFGAVVDVLEMLSSALDRIEPYFNTFYENAIAPLLNTLGTNLNDWLTGLSEKSRELKTGFENGDYDEQIKSTFDKLTETLDRVYIIISSLFTGEAPSSDDIEKLGGTESTFGKINDIALSINSIFKNICDILGNLSEDFVNWLKDEGLSQIRDFIDRFDKFIKDNKDTIIRILEKLGETIWTAILSFAEAMLNLLQFICDNETLVISVLDTIIKALDFVGKHASDCAKVFLALTGFKLVLDVLGSISSAVGTISGIALAGKLNKLCKIIGSGSTGTVGAVNTLSGTLTNKLGNALKGAVTGIKNFASSITGTLANAIANVTGATGGAAAAGVGVVAGAAVVTVEGTRQIVDMVSDTIAGYQAADDYVKQIIEKWADKDENGAYYMEQAVYDRIIEILQNDKYDAEYKKAKETYGVFAGLADTDIYQRGFKVTARDFANAMGDDIKKACIIVEDTSDIVNKKVSKASDNLNTITDGVNVDVAVTMPSITVPNIKINSTRSVRGYAQGGIPQQGSLFFANEQGNAELIGNFGGYSGVANQNMIIKAMQQAISSSMYDAVKRALSEQGSMSASNIEVCRDGIFVGSEKSIRKLADMLNNASRNSRQNIANTSFGM